MDEKLKQPVTLTRVLDASPDRVWRAWTEPEQIKKWWGPAGFSAPSVKVDLRVGGKYLYCMRGRPGPGLPEQDFWSGGTFKAIVPGQKLVVLDSFTDDEGNPLPSSAYGMDGFPPEMEITVTFEARPDGKTKLTITYAQSVPPEHLANMTSGWNSSLDKLNAVAGEPNA